MIFAQLIINSFSTLEEFIDSHPEQDLKGPGKQRLTTIYNKFKLDY